MNMLDPRRASRVLLASAMAITVAACDASEPGPEAAAEQWLDATIEQDGNRAGRLICDDVRLGQNAGGVVLAALGFVTGDMLDIDLGDVSYETTAQDGDTATVRITGEWRVGAAGLSVPNDIDESLTMVREDGEWKVCD